MEGHALLRGAELAELDGVVALPDDAVALAVFAARTDEHHVIAGRGARVLFVVGHMRSLSRPETVAQPRSAARASGSARKLAEEARGA